MRNLGLTIFALVSLVVHVTAATMFLNGPEKAMEERGAGVAALEMGSLFDSAEQEAVEASELKTVKPTPRTLEQTPVDRAIPVKTFVQETVQPKQAQRIEPKPIKVSQATDLAEPLVEELTANEALAKPEIFKPREIKPVETKQVKPRKKIKEVKATKPKPVKKVTPKKKKKKTKPKRKSVKTAKKKQNARKASKASRKGGEIASKRGRKNATGGNGGKSRTANGKALTTNYKGKVRRKIIRKKRSLGRRHKGTAVIRFTVSANGRMSGLRLTRSSGNARVDKEALAMARRAAPFPAFPAGMPRNAKQFTVPIKFTGGRR
ncbi:energy transducer TonB family protein [Cohaesibacter gelatinilyticus]|uniref:Protein TonB n=1 Tax=Cohaesibacter gelatinilyticus TaxID=372072 RepID=A0A285PL48_9HYPH|nr:energy transducer TonB [Cohaesibacter gelatinilyticus]SNZ20591.1 protein TonB [Cohaesibacter gelatinilyticus]